MRLFYSDIFELPLPETHRFPMSKYRLLRERVEVELANFGVQLEPAPTATDAELGLIHCPEYIRRVQHGELSALEIRRIGFPWSEKMVIRSRRSTGASIAAAQAALQGGVSVNLAGGTHHAFADSGQGYCVFNDVAVAARVMQNSGTVSRVLIVDCDVHQGNGTASIFSGDESVRTFSIHCEQNFPFRKTDGDLDIALPAGTGDDKYLRELATGLEQALTESRPDLVFYVSGADPFEGDRLGKLKLSKKGLAQRDELVFQRTAGEGIPTAISMAGGYSPNVEDIVDIHFQTIVSAHTFYRRAECQNSGPDL